MMHECDEQCDRLRMRPVHERQRLAARAKRQAKLHGKRPKLRWTRRPGASYCWIDETWGLVEQQ
jgi:hypothetical protein